MGDHCGGQVINSTVILHGSTNAISPTLNEIQNQDTPYAWYTDSLPMSATFCAFTTLSMSGSSM
jgi:hypothetical protein